MSLRAHERALEPTSDGAPVSFDVEWSDDFEGRITGLVRAVHAQITQTCSGETDKGAPEIGSGDIAPDGGFKTRGDFYRMVGRVPAFTKPGGDANGTIEEVPGSGGGCSFAGPVTFSAAGRPQT